MNQKVYTFTPFYEPCRSVFTISVEPTFKLSDAMSAHGRYLIDRLFAQYPPLEPHEHVLLADVLSAKVDDTTAALTFVSLMNALLTPTYDIYTVTMRTSGTSDFTHKKAV